jgi:hypothetical protein
MDKENVVYIHHGILFIHKQNEILSCVVIWIELGTIMLIEISQAQKDKYLMISLIRQSYKVHLIEVRSIKVIPEARESGDEEERLIYV